MANTVYNRAKGLLLDGTLDLTSDTLKVMLVGTGYTPNADDDFADTPAASEISVTGYTPGFAGSGRKTLGTKAFVVNDTNDRGEFTAANLTWTGLAAGATIKWAIVYKHITSDAASPLIAALDVHATGLATNGGDIGLNFTSGIVLQIT